MIIRNNFWVKPIPFNKCAMCVDFALTLFFSVKYEHNIQLHKSVIWHVKQNPPCPPTSYVILQPIGTGQVSIFVTASVCSHSQWQQQHPSLDTWHWDWENLSQKVMALSSHLLYLRNIFWTLQGYNPSQSIHPTLHYQLWHVPYDSSDRSKPAWFVEFKFTNIRVITLLAHMD